MSSAPLFLGSNALVGATAHPVKLGGFFNRVDWVILEAYRSIQLTAGSVRFFGQPRVKLANYDWVSWLPFLRPTMHINECGEQISMIDSQSPLHFPATPYLNIPSPLGVGFEVGERKLGDGVPTLHINNTFCE